MRKLYTSMTVTCLLALAAASAQAASIQFDFGNNGVYDGTVAPAHAAGDLTASDTTWNQILGTGTNGTYIVTGLSYTNGDAATGVSLQHWRAGSFAFPVKFNGTPSTYDGSVGIYNTTLMGDEIHYNSDIGIRVKGLDAGTYKVYAIVVNPDHLSYTFDVGIGVGDLGADNSASVTNPIVASNVTHIDPSAKSGNWVDGENYALTTVTTTSTSDYINILIDPSTNPGLIQGLQIVSVSGVASAPLPASASLTGVGLLGVLGLRGRRGRRAV